jgi:hypothetical protein
MAMVQALVEQEAEVKYRKRYEAMLKGQRGK